MAETIHKPGPYALRAVRCPFARADRRKQFDGMVTDYRLRNRALFRFPNSENRQNNIGEAFWRGWHGEPFIWDKDSPLYVAFKAGALIARATGSTS